jgi:hypothetical protein
MGATSERTSIRPEIQQEITENMMIGRLSRKCPDVPIEMIMALRMAARLKMSVDPVAGQEYWRTVKRGIFEAQRTLESARKDRAFVPRQIKAWFLFYLKRDWIRFRKFFYRAAT